GKLPAHPLRYAMRMNPVPPLLGGLLALCCAGGALAQAAVPGGMAERTLPCTICHGEQGRSAAGVYFPRIAGKPAGYLYNQLINFREGRRRYPLMIYMVDNLSDDYLREIAEYFAGLSPPYPPRPVLEVSPTLLEKGRQLVMHGDSAKNVPACVACHGDSLTGVAPAVPGLLGLPRDYINAQFGAWKSGLRGAAAPDCMGQVAARLTAEEISAASAWLASQPLPASTAPAPAGSVRLPLPCGGVNAGR
ncbi:MAG: c-type cytochrome, partial [Noviherbaspirillum sp.]